MRSSATRWSITAPMSICSDGDLMEGISQEAIALAGHLKLNRLIFLYDDNHISIDGPTSLSDSVDQIARFQPAAGTPSRIDGHNPVEIERAIRDAQKSAKPSLIACSTTIGFGAPTKAGTSKAHSEALGDRGSRRRQEESRLDRAALHGAGDDPRRMAQGRQPRDGPRGRRGRSAHGGRAAEGRVRPAHGQGSAGRRHQGNRGSPAEIRGGKADARDTQVERGGDRGC